MSTNEPGNKDSESNETEKVKGNTLNFGKDNVKDITLSEIFGTNDISRKEMNKAFRLFIRENDITNKLEKSSKKLLKQYWNVVDFEDMKLKPFNRHMVSAGASEEQIEESKKIFKLQKNQLDKFETQIETLYNKIVGSK